MGANLGSAIVTNGDFSAYVCYSVATWPSSQIALGGLVHPLFKLDAFKTTCAKNMWLTISRKSVHIIIVASCRIFMMLLVSSRNVCSSCTVTGLKTRLFTHLRTCLCMHGCSTFDARFCFAIKPSTGGAVQSNIPECCYK